MFQSSFASVRQFHAHVNAERRFTLIELLVVIGIIAVLA